MSKRKKLSPLSESSWYAQVIVKIVEDTQFQSSVSDVPLEVVKDLLMTDYSVDVSHAGERSFVKNGLQMAIDNDILERVSGRGLEGAVRYCRLKKKRRNTNKSAENDDVIVIDDFSTPDNKISLAFYESTRKRVVLPKYTTENAFSCTLQIRNQVLTLHDLKTLQSEETFDRRELRAMRQACKSRHSEISWMNDNTIHCFMEAVADTSTKIIGSIEAKLILKGGNTLRLFHNSSGTLNSSWVSCEKIFLPYCVDSSHWVLIYVNVKWKKIYCLDPTGTWKMNTSQWNRLIAKLDTLETDKDHDWQFRKRPVCCQNDESSCGPFICHYAECIILDTSLTEPVNPVDIRNHILETLITAANKKKK